MSLYTTYTLVSPNIRLEPPPPEKIVKKRVYPAGGDFDNTSIILVLDSNKKKIKNNNKTSIYKISSTKYLKWASCISKCIYTCIYKYQFKSFISYYSPLFLCFDYALFLPTFWIYMNLNPLRSKCEKWLHPTIYRESVEYCTHCSKMVSLLKKGL